MRRRLCAGINTSDLPFDVSPLDAVDIQHWYCDLVYLALCGNTLDLSTASRP